MRLGYIPQNKIGIFRYSIFILLWFVQIHCALAGIKPKDPNRIYTDYFDKTRLEKTIFKYTNIARKKNHLLSFIWDDALALTARDHSIEMAKLKYMAHESPVSKNKTLKHRLENHDVTLVNHAFGENLGVDYFLDVAGKPFYMINDDKGEVILVDGKTEKPVPHQTYKQFAKKIVANWMKSPGHRKNILNKQYQLLGIGISKGEYQGLPAIYVTQNFMGSLTSAAKIHKK